MTFRVPHTLVLLYAMVVVAWLLCWVLPAGSFETVVNDHGREEVVAGTYQVLPDVAAPPVWSLVTVVPRGLEAAAGIIFFIFIVGGALAVIRETGAIDAALGRLLKHFGARPALLIFIGIAAFALGSSTIGMAEEYIPLAAILITLCVGMRMDTVAAIGVMVVGYCVGYGVAVINPFTVILAQEVAGLPPTSGMAFRLAMFAPFVLIGFWHVWRYAKKVRQDPSASLVADVPEAQPPPAPAEVVLSGRQKAVLALALLALVIMAWGIKQQGWYLVELGGLFIAVTVVVGLVAGLHSDRIARTFTLGAAELAGTALLIGVARGIELMLRDGQVLDTIVHALATPLSEVGAAGAAVGMLFIQSVLNFFIPSGSGQAYVTMPLMAPIADLVGVSRQVAVLAFQMGDGFMNMIVPTNAVLMGIIGLAGIPYARWFRFVWPLVVQLLVAGSITLVIAVWVGYQ